jgi:hypothetical protein
MNKRTLSVLIFLLLSASGLFAQNARLWGFLLIPYADTGSSFKISESEEVLGETGIYTLICEGSVSTAKERYPWAGIVWEPVQRGLRDRLKKAKGIQFRVMGLDGNYNFNFKVKTSNISDDDFYARKFPIFKDKSTLVTMYFTDKHLAQEGWGVPKPFVQSEMTDLLIQTIDRSLPPFKFKIWDVEVID